MSSPSKPKEPSIKGAVIKDPRDWMRSAYGPEAYQAALAKLSADERAFVDGPLLAGSWYPIAPWDRFQEAMREEALARRAHTELQFNMRNMREAGSAIVRGIYKLLLGLMSPQSAVDKVVIIYSRVYSEGHCEIVKNERGQAILRYCDASPCLPEKPDPQLLEWRHVRARDEQGQAHRWQDQPRRNGRRKARVRGECDVRDVVPRGGSPVDP